MALSTGDLDQLHQWITNYNSNGGSPRGTLSNGMQIGAFQTGLAGGQDGGTGSNGTQFSVFDGKPYYDGQMNYDFDSSGNSLGSHASSKDNNLRNFMLSAAAMAGGVAAFGGAGSAGAGATLGEGWAGGAAGAAGDAAGAAAGAGAGSASYLSPGEVDQTLASQVAGNGGVDGSLAGTGTFNAAKDSQLASDQLGLTGTDTTSAGTVSTGGAGNTSLDTGTGTGVDGTSKVADDTVKKIITTAGGGAGAGGGSGGGGGNGGGSGGDLSSILQLLGGAYGMNQQGKASQQMLDYLKSRQQMNDNMYADGSPEATRLWDEMSRKDAAAGRNSQYGPRSVDLAARIAQLKMDANTKLTTGIASNYAAAINQGSNSYLNMLPGLMNLAGGSGGNGTNSLLGLINKYINGGKGGDQSAAGGDANGTTVDANGNKINVSGTDAGASNSLSDGTYDGANWDAMAAQTAKDSSTDGGAQMSDLSKYLQQNKTGPSGTITRGFNNNGAFVQDYSKYNPGNPSGWDDTATNMWTNSDAFKQGHQMDLLQAASMANTGQSADFNKYGNMISGGQSAADIAKQNGWNYNGMDSQTQAQQVIAANPAKYSAAQQDLYKRMGWTVGADGNLYMSDGTRIGKA